MGKPISINQLAALQEVAEVENALLDGHPALTTIGNHQRKSALRIAAERMGMNPQSLRNRIGTSEVPGSIWNNYHFAVDWTLYKTPIFAPIKIPQEEPEPVDDRQSVKDRQIAELKEEIKRLKNPPPLGEATPEFAVDNMPPPAFRDGAAAELISLPDNTFLFGAAGDLHAASKYARWDVRDDLYRQFIEAGAQCSFDTGNWIDGEANFNRYDLMVHGLDRQCRLLAEKHPRGLKTYAVWGDDHEGWYVQREGIDVGRYNESIMQLEGHDWHNLGFMEAHVKLTNFNSGKTASMAVVHPGGGSAYALSYSIQKIVESYEGGEKPAVGLYGHYHKLWAGIIRNVFVAQTGCQQDQTTFMRKKRLEAHVGGILIKLRQDPRTGAIISMMPEIIRYFNVGYYEGSTRWSHHGDITPMAREQIGTSTS